MVISGMPAAGAENVTDIAVTDTGHLNQTLGILPADTPGINETEFSTIPASDTGNSSIVMITSLQEINGTEPAIATHSCPDNCSLMEQRLARKIGYPPARQDEQTNDNPPGNRLMRNSVSTLGSTDPESYVYLMQWGTPGSGNGQFNNPEGIAVDVSGNVYVTDDNNRVQKFRSDGTYVTQWGTNGSGIGQFYYVNGIAVDPSGNVYAVDMGNFRIQKFGPDGTFITQWGTQGADKGQFYFAQAAAVDTPGNVYVTEKFANERVQKFSSGGAYHSQWGTQGAGNGQFNYLHGIAADTSGNVYVADSWNHRIQKFSSDGTYLAQWGTKGTGNGQFDHPYGIATDTSGNVYVVDTYNSRVQKFRSDGTYVTQWGTYGNGNGQFNFAFAIAVDTSGNVYVTDDNNRVQVFKPVGVPEVFTYSMTNTFSKYAGKDNCDNMADALKGIGWGDPVFYNTMESVTKSDFGVNPSPNQKTLNDAVLHYHVGHGGIPYGEEENLSGLGLLDQPGSFLSPSDVEGKWGNKNKWVILHSCYALVDDRWGKALSTSHGVLGFKTMVNVNPEFTNRFFHYAIDEKKTIYSAYRKTTYVLYKNDPVPSGTIDGKPDYNSPQEIPVAAVVFGNINQAFGDHLPDIGTGVTPDSVEGPLYRDQWRCNEEPR
ncbi:MAG: hypothetical protein CVV32_04715 [Methanomicrobiales archaeon HGW-Methanomicrobiales-3]|jgi:hypothetical protein|nr:MAG: hypothetical protein CVV32_04715 [Methanomicrobiales archaeon HGW-Methanomicrobiales-3]